jgi:hypothetical protein
LRVLAWRVLDNLRRYMGIPTMSILFLFLLWWVIGAAGFVYWWTSEYDLEPQHLIVMFMVGFCGPLTWPIGRWLHGESSPTILIRKRNK